MVIIKRIERVYKFQINRWEKSSLKKRSQKLNRIEEDGKKEGDKWDE